MLIYYLCVKLITDVFLTLTSVMERQILAFQNEGIQGTSAHETHSEVEEEEILNIKREPWVTNGILTSLRIGETDNLLKIVRSRKLKCFGHANKRRGTFIKCILQGSVEGWKQRGRTGKNWHSNITVDWVRKNMVDAGQATVDRQRFTEVNRANLWHNPQWCSCDLIKGYGIEKEEFLLEKVLLDPIFILKWIHFNPLWIVLGSPHDVSASQGF